jgi:hypothetical protein
MISSEDKSWYESQARKKSSGSRGLTGPEKAITGLQSRISQAGGKFEFLVGERVDAGASVSVAIREVAALHPETHADFLERQKIGQVGKLTGGLKNA